MPLLYQILKPGQPPSYLLGTIHFQLSSHLMPWHLLPQLQDVDALIVEHHPVTKEERQIVEELQTRLNEHYTGMVSVRMGAVRDEIEKKLQQIDEISWECIDEYDSIEPDFAEKELVELVELAEQIEKRDFAAESEGGIDQQLITHFTRCGKLIESLEDRGVDKVDILFVQPDDGTTSSQDISIVQRTIYEKIKEMSKECAPGFDRSRSSAQLLRTKQIFGYTLKKLEKEGIIKIAELLQDEENFFTAYAAQDLDFFARQLLVFQEQQKAGDLQAGRLLKNICTRNCDWVAHIKSSPLLQQKSCLIAVGTLHLPGNDGLLKKLEEEGFELRPMVIPKEQFAISIMQKQQRLETEKKFILEHLALARKTKTASIPSRETKAIAKKTDVTPAQTTLPLAKPMANEDHGTTKSPPPSPKLKP